MDMKLELKNVSYAAIKKPRQEKGEYAYLLKGITTVFEPGKLNAIMGPNGSGKTTLLNLLFGLCPSESKTSGSILYGGKSRSMKDWFKRVSYVDQTGYKINDETVERAIKFVQSLQPQISDTYYDELIKNLELTNVLKTRIAAISGGEHKRVLLAIELIMGKSILILDELTSDLDSHLALKVTNYLKMKAKKENRILIMTVHQPSVQLFLLFDNFLFLHKGLQIYSGPSDQIRAFLIDTKLAGASEITTAELLFEIFSIESSFQEVEKYKPVINEFVKQKELQWDPSCFKTSNKSVRCTLNEYSFLELKRLLFRQIERDFFTMSQIYRIIWACGFVGVSFLFYNSMKKLYDMVADVVDILPCVGEEFFFFTLQFVGLYGCFGSSSTFYETNIAQSRVEIQKGIFTSFSLLTSSLIYDILSNIPIVILLIIEIFILPDLDNIRGEIICSFAVQAILFQFTDLFIKSFRAYVREITPIFEKVLLMFDSFFYHAILIMNSLKYFQEMGAWVKYLFAFLRLLILLLFPYNYYIAYMINRHYPLCNYHATSKESILSRWKWAFFDREILFENLVNGIILACTITFFGALIFLRKNICPKIRLELSRY